MARPEQLGQLAKRPWALICYQRQCPDNTGDGRDRRRRGYPRSRHRACRSRRCKKRHCDVPYVVHRANDQISIFSGPLLPLPPVSATLSLRNTSCCLSCRTHAYRISLRALGMHSNSTSHVESGVTSTTRRLALFAQKHYDILAQPRIAIRPWNSQFVRHPASRASIAS